MPLLAQRHSMLRHAIGLAPLIALAVPVDRAEAACDPASPVNDTVVTCTGTTSNGATGFGNSSDTGNTYNIVSGASVTERPTASCLTAEPSTISAVLSDRPGSAFSLTAEANRDQRGRRHHFGCSSALPPPPPPLTIRASLRARSKESRADTVNVTSNTGTISGGATGTGGLPSRLSTMLATSRQRCEWERHLRGIRRCDQRATGFIEGGATGVSGAYPRDCRQCWRHLLDGCEWGRNLRRNPWM